MTNVRLASDAVIPQSDVTSPAGDAATLDALLIDDSPMLIGISGSPEARTAIVLSREGDILRLTLGDDMLGSIVTGIGETQVQLQTLEGLFLVLTIPG